VARQTKEGQIGFQLEPERATASCCCHLANENEKDAAFQQNTLSVVCVGADRRRVQEVGGVSAGRIDSAAWSRDIFACLVV